MNNFARTARPSGLNKTLFKHSMSDGRDCGIEWMSDFAKMEILLYVPFLSPTHLLDCLSHMARRDERFEQTGITSALQINSRFNIKVCVSHGDGEVWFRLRVYKLCTGNENQDRLEVELYCE